MQPPVALTTQAYAYRHLNDLISHRIATDTSQAGTTSPCCHSLLPCLCSSIPLVPLSSATYRDTRHPSSLLSEIAGYTTIIFAPYFFVTLSRAAIYFDVAIFHRAGRISQTKYPSFPAYVQPIDSKPGVDQFPRNDDKEFRCLKIYLLLFVVYQVFFSFIFRKRSRM